VTSDDIDQTMDDVKKHVEEEETKGQDVVKEEIEKDNKVKVLMKDDTKKVDIEKDENSNYKVRNKNVKGQILLKVR
jgi:hypothetical protein